jgi:putative hydrolase
VSTPGEPTSPFGGAFGDLAKMLASLAGSGPLNWDLARQLAVWVATEGVSEPNVEPLERMHLEDLARVAELRVAEATGLPVCHTGRIVEVVPVTRAEWARRELEAHRELFEALARSLSVAPPSPGDTTEADPASQFLGTLPQVLGPLLMATMVGSMLGHLAQRALARYDLPLPGPVVDEIVVVPTNVDAFAKEWSLPVDDLRLWLLMHELAHHAVLGLPHVRQRLGGLLVEYASGFSTDATVLEATLGDIDPTDASSFQRVLGDPELLLGAVQTEDQRKLLPQIAAVTSAITGFVDHVLDTAGRPLITTYGMVTEALRRRRVEDVAGLRYAGRLLGLDLSQAAYERGAAFVRGVVERAGEDALVRLWESAETLPTPAEIDAPGLWLARLELGA